MLLKITETTDGKYVGKYVEYNDAAKILTLPSGESIVVDEEMAGDSYTLKNSNYVVIATK